MVKRSLHTRKSIGSIPIPPTIEPVKTGKSGAKGNILAERIVAG